MLKSLLLSNLLFFLLFNPFITIVTLLSFLFTEPINPYPDSFVCPVLRPSAPFIVYSNGFLFDCLILLYVKIFSLYKLYNSGKSSIILFVSITRSLEVVCKSG